MKLTAYDTVSTILDKNRSWIEPSRCRLVTKEVSYRRYYTLAERLDVKTGLKKAKGPEDLIIQYTYYVVYTCDQKMFEKQIKAAMEDDDVLLLLDRSSMGFKWNVRMCNQVGVIDADYYNNSSNEGHMWIRIQNEGDKDYIVKKGQGMCQGMFIKYLKTDDDLENNKQRISEY